jgi:hypothetical protein
MDINGHGLRKAVLKHTHSKRCRAFWAFFDLAKRLPATDF